MGDILNDQLTSKTNQQASKLRNSGKFCEKYPSWKNKTHIQCTLVSRRCPTSIEPFNIGCERLHPDEIKSLSVPIEQLTRSDSRFCQIIWY